MVISLFVINLLRGYTLNSTYATETESSYIVSFVKNKSHINSHFLNMEIVIAMKVILSTRGTHASFLSVFFLSTYINIYNIYIVFYYYFIFYIYFYYFYYFYCIYIKNSNVCELQDDEV